MQRGRAQRRTFCDFLARDNLPNLQSVAINRDIAIGSVDDARLNRRLPCCALSVAAGEDQLWRLHQAGARLAVEDFDVVAQCYDSAAVGREAEEMRELRLRRPANR